MFLLTNPQRVCFGLTEVSDSWICRTLKASPYQDFQTQIYIDGTIVRKAIFSGDTLYSEQDYNEPLSEDLQFLMPKTSRGKPVSLTTANFLKRSPSGMCLRYANGCVSLYSSISQKNYYESLMEAVSLPDIPAFIHWAESWCQNTTQEDLADISRFAAAPRSHVRFREGDVFRYRISRRQWGYGRILLDYERMRKQKEPFWDILMMKPLVCSAYHIITEDPFISVDVLPSLPSLPSCIMADNRLYYGEYEIIGNIPISEHEDYPILYGQSIRFGETAIMLQHGKTCRILPEETRVISGIFLNNSVGFSLNVRLPVLQACIHAGSNDPYWAQNTHNTRCDLRNPAFSQIRESVCRQFGIGSLL